HSPLPLALHYAHTPHTRFRFSTFVANRHRSETPTAGDSGARRHRRHPHRARQPLQPSSRPAPDFPRSVRRIGVRTSSTSRRRLLSQPGQLPRQSAVALVTSALATAETSPRPVV
ncbi:hypothetical protein HAX54_023805, partial [Datura stramonium]|nr:hypothetical protein [Datura stramonium]